MKTAKLLTVLFALSMALAGRSQTNFTFSSGTLNTVIPDANPVGIASSTSISGVIGYISSIEVNLNITGGFNGDLYAYLAGPAGQTAILLNRVGLTSSNPFGYGNSGFNITLTGSGNNIHNYQSFSYGLNGSGQLTNSWAADGRNISPLSSGTVFDAAPVSASLNLFNDSLPNGSWTLFLADLSGGSQSTLVSWGMTIVTVPEPQTWAMLAGGAAALLALRRRR